MEWLARLRLLALAFFVMGCSGGGCSNCAGGALTPIRGGYPVTPETRLARSVQVRVSDQGLRSVSMLGPDLLRNALGTQIPIPNACGDFGIGRYSVCSSGNCGLTITRSDLQLTFAPPDRIVASIRLGFRGTVPVETCTLGCGTCCRGGAVCPAPLPTTLTLDTANCTRAMRPDYIGLRTNIAIRRDTHAERRSFFRADVVPPMGAMGDIQEIPGEELNSCMIAGCNGALCGLLPIIQDTVLLDAFRGALGGAVNPVRTALQHKSMPDPPGCPTGTRADGELCRYMDNTPVPSLLGLELGGNFGALLGSISPGVRANGSFLLAAGDPSHDAEVTATGMTLNMFGAVRSQAHNACVPRVDPPAMPTIPEWMNLRQNNLPGTTRATDLGLGVAEDFLNHAMFQWWDSGMFCLGVGSSLAPDRLNAMLFATLIPSLRDVMYPSVNAPVALVLRPQRPPRVTLGTGTGEATMNVVFERLMIDLYVWSEERFVRALTITSDVTAPVNLTQDAMGLRPSLGTVATQNTSVALSSFLPVAPPALAAQLNALIGTAVMSLGGSLPAIALPSIPIPGSMGAPVGTINIVLPEGGLRPVAEGSSRYLGLFADLRYRAGMASTASTDTEATVEHVDAPGDVASVRLRLSPGASLVGGPYEYAWRVDGLTWSMWTRDTVVDVRSPTFAFAGEHTIEVQSRRAGEAETSDPEPARVTVTMTRPATVPVTTTGATPLRIPGGNDQLIRGGPSTDAGGGCGCGVVGGASGSTGLGWMAAALALVAIVRRRAARR
jgi:hypothetical protein